MPFFKASGSLVYYAHVPKCGGSSVGEYIRDRFGALAFRDNHFMDLPEGQRWTRSSPQHVDAATLARLIPPEFFDACFAIVRHPVARAISTYHFQQEVEGRVAAGQSFSDWLASLPGTMARDPFAADNHIRPMTQIVPAGATIFHMEHGLDSLVAWFDGVTGSADGPRAIGARNARGDYAKDAAAPVAKVVPSAADLDLITRLYAEDFARFGYDPASPQPKAEAPRMTPDFLAARQRAVRRMNSPLGRLRHRIKLHLRRNSF